MNPVKRRRPRPVPPSSDKMVKTMERLEKRTLVLLTRQLSSRRWTDAELDELVEAKLGIITAFRDLLAELDVLCGTDLGTTAPAQGVQKRTAAE
jgi:hypothetical protein